MNSVDFLFRGQTLSALPSGALFWSAENILTVSDLHLGKSERIARLGGALLPPYDTRETLSRLAEDIRAMAPRTVICLGDSFDDLAAGAALSDEDRALIRTLQSGRRWIWIEGNHDPGPLDLAGDHLAEHRQGPLIFRHIAATSTDPGEVSGHYHPKARIKRASRPCFMADDTRLILPAYGAYTGGLDWTAPALRSLFTDRAFAYLTGQRVLTVPVPRAA